MFQMPSNYKYKQENLETLRTFFETINLENKAVVEFRDPLWWKAVKVIVNTGVASARLMHLVYLID
jgi:uncharacterized protein YecE (DUF72 family)